jgi:hypothetical protein
MTANRAVVVGLVLLSSHLVALLPLATWPWMGAVLIASALVLILGAYAFAQAGS